MDYPVVDDFRFVDTAHPVGASFFGCRSQPHRDAKTVLVVNGIHPPETNGIELGDRLETRLAAPVGTAPGSPPHSKLRRQFNVIYMRRVNPASNGSARCNARGVDLNRTFSGLPGDRRSSAAFTLPDAMKGPRCSGSRKSIRQLETQAIFDIIEAADPFLIVALHGTNVQKEGFFVDIPTSPGSGRLTAARARELTCRIAQRAWNTLVATGITTRLRGNRRGASPSQCADAGCPDVSNIGWVAQGAIGASLGLWGAASGRTVFTVEIGNPSPIPSGTTSAAFRAQTSAVIDAVHAALEDELDALGPIP
ncbi:hypothetical protein WMF20_09365 [Sorangium sp. So ce834]|uniref:hypothetical protein n=1 Tax=Sorangium sp. So ce834 TaxID=3133321 RepID=UPI003F6345B7